MKTRFYILATAVLANLFVHAYAQTLDENSTVSEVNISPSYSNTIETISITGSRAPIAKPLVAGSVSIINSAQIKASGAVNISELLRTVAGVNLSQTGPLGSLAEVRFRGSESNHILVLIDGVEINDLGQGGLVDFSHIMLSQVERIEILRGPQSAIWGSSAIAGIISITTKQANSNQLTPELQVAAGDRDTFQTSVNLSKVNESLRYSINASLFKSAGENISREGQESDGYKNTSLSATLNYAFSQNNALDLNLRLLNYVSDFDATDFSTGLIADADNRSFGEQTSLGINWRVSPFANSQNSRLQNNAYSQLWSLHYTKQANDNYSNSDFSGSTQGEKLRLLWNNRFNLAHNTFVNIGLEAVQENYTQAGPIVYGDPNQSQSNSTYSIVSSGQWALTTALNISASIRADNNDEFNNTESYRVGGVYQISQNWRIFLSTGKAIKNPTFTERFGYFPQTFLGNPLLTPENQTSIEAGIEGNLSIADHSLTAQLSLFDAKLENEILGFVFSPNSGQFTAQNAEGESKRAGIELSLQGAQGEFSWQAQYSYLDADELSSNNDITPELRRANHNASLSFTYAFNRKHSLYMQADYTGSRLDLFYTPYPQNAQVIGLNAYWLLSANYTYQYNAKLNINTRLSNMLNRQYEDVVGFSGQSSRILLNVQYSW